MILLRIRYSNVGPERNAIQARGRTLAANTGRLLELYFWMTSMAVTRKCDRVIKLKLSGLTWWCDDGGMGCFSQSLKYLLQYFHLRMLLCRLHHHLISELSHLLNLPTHQAFVRVCPNITIDAVQPG